MELPLPKEENQNRLSVGHRDGVSSSASACVPEGYPFPDARLPPGLCYPKPLPTPALLERFPDAAPSNPECSVLGWLLAEGMASWSP